MSTGAITAVVIAALAVMSAVGGMVALTYRIGRLVGKVETLILESGSNYARAERNLGVMDADLKRHLAWHGGTRNRR